MPLGQSYDEAKTQVERLVERFARNLEVYERTEYKEAQPRVEFIDLLFEALGWDPRNAQGYAEQYKHVIHEDALKVGGAVRAPDYYIRVGGTRKRIMAISRSGTLLASGQGSGIWTRTPIGTSGIP